MGELAIQVMDCLCPVSQWALREGCWRRWSPGQPEAPGCAVGVTEATCS